MTSARFLEALAQNLDKRGRHFLGDNVTDAGFPTAGVAHHEGVVEPAIVDLGSVEFGRHHFDDLPLPNDVPQARRPHVVDFDCFPFFVLVHFSTPFKVRLSEPLWVRYVTSSIDRIDGMTSATVPCRPQW